MRLRAFAVTLVLVVAGSLAACGSDTAQSTPTTAGNTEAERSERLIGYQLKRLDQLLESTFDRLLGDAGLTRRQWQTLNTLAAGPRGHDELIDALRPFWEVNNENLTELTDDLIGRGWIHAQPDGTVALTSAGRSVHTAAGTEVARIRDIAARGISQDDFTLMMDVLRRMIANLDADADHR
ncbi:MarR family winged helix-turn-helix transcriptional regulator [Nocardia otitidiscaviarum]|uniref:MarR family winged helix-turn-helix transcriptional regulator n=1 Tax=Nocardia otitidiscaviarum TaxID=1823 RepID=UPI001E2E4C6F|nr:MarR family transcriptional regulator [Nocardia otitidiscaviarum]